MRSPITAFPRLAFLAALLCLAGCVVVGPQPGANPYPPVPAPQAEIIPKPPVSEDPLVWQPGHWDWLGGSYVWTAGLWVPRAGHGVGWQPGYWAQSQGGGYVWVAPHWI